MIKKPPNNVIPFPKTPVTEDGSSPENNVIQFPLQPKAKEIDPKDEAEIQERISRLHFMHCEESISALTPYAMDRILNLGFIINSPEYLKDIALVIESMRAIMYKYHGFAHPLHQTAQDAFIEKDGLVTWNNGAESTCNDEVIVSEDDILLVDDEGNIS